MAEKSRLGKGLDALIAPSESSLGQGDVVQVEIAKIEANPHQPRSSFPQEELSELADSINTHGIIQPLLVRRNGDKDDYTLIAGERRLQAAKLAGLVRVPVVLRDADDQELVELALVENLQRSDLSPLEAAAAYKQLHDEFGLGHKEIAERVGKSRAAITNTLGLLNLSKEVQAAIASRAISEGHGRAIKALESMKAQNAALKTVVDKELSVRQTEELVRKLQGKKNKKVKAAALSPEMRAIQDQLREALGTKVGLKSGAKGGRITLHYYSDEELDKLVQKLLQN